MSRKNRRLETREEPSIVWYYVRATVEAVALVVMFIAAIVLSAAFI